jgi:hypothetical protein
MPSSTQTEAISEPVNPEPMTSTRLGFASRRSRSPAASPRVRMVNTPSSAASSGTGHGRARTPVATRIRSNSTSCPSASMTRLRSRSRPVAATPSCHSASMSRRRGSVVSAEATKPVCTCFDSGGRSYGSSGSSPITVSEPVKPSARSCSAAFSPASDAPTITMRPSRRSRSPLAATTFSSGGGCGRSATSTCSACTGHAAAARSTFTRWSSDGAGSNMSASSPTIRNASGARNAHCAYP